MSKTRHHPTTRPAAAIRDRLAATHARRDCMAVAGPSGIGKSTIVHAEVARAGLELVDVRLPAQASRKEILSALVVTAGAGTHLPRGEFVVLQEQLLCILAGREAVVVVDNAEALDRTALQTLAHLHDDPSATWTLVLVGLPSLTDRLRHEPRLTSCWDVLQLDDLSRRDLVATVRGMDHLLEEADQELLVEIDHVLCRGNLHVWARFVDTMRRLADEHLPGASTLVPELASAAVDGTAPYVLVPA